MRLRVEGPALYVSVHRGTGDGGGTADTAQKRYLVAEEYQREQNRHHDLALKRGCRGGAQTRGAEEGCRGGVQRKMQRRSADEGMCSVVGEYMVQEEDICIHSILHAT
jgi:hypothetical protein